MRAVNESELHRSRIMLGTRVVATLLIFVAAAAAVWFIWQRLYAPQAVRVVTIAQALDEPSLVNRPIRVAGVFVPDSLRRDGLRLEFRVASQPTGKVRDVLRQPSIGVVYTIQPPSKETGWRDSTFELLNGPNGGIAVTGTLRSDGTIAADSVAVRTHQTYGTPATSTP